MAENPKVGIEGQSAHSGVYKEVSILWDDMCRALRPQVPPPDIMKKDKFLSGLSNNLRWRVDLKKPASFAEAVEISKKKEWKLDKMSQLGMDLTPITMGMMLVETMGVQQPMEVVPNVVRTVSPQTMPTTVAVTTSNEGLK